MEQNETIQEITKSYEEKIVELEKKHQDEIKLIKENAEKEKQKALDEQKVQHNKEIADIILGRKEIGDINSQNEDEKNDKSYFEIAVEKTKEKVKGGF